jgi:membrane protease subunit HflK
MDYTNPDYSGGPSYESAPKKPKRKPGRLWKLLWLVPLAVLVLALALDSFYTLKEDQYAVITTFGKPSTVSASGLQFKLPFVQKCTKVSKTIQGFPLGYREGSSETVEDESLMITYDYNFVNVDFYVEYRVTDPIRFLYNSDDPVAILKMLCQSYIRDTIGLYDVDSVITTGKSEIQADIKEKIVKRLDQEDLGIQLTNITIQDAEPPTAEVQQAFTAVETAKQGADTAVNNARKYANEVTPAAEADADEIIKQAEAYRQSKINEATGQAARFSSLFSEYEKYPLITKQRLFYEAMEDVLPNLKLYIVDESTGVQTSLPLDQYATVNVEGGTAGE